MELRFVDQTAGNPFPATVQITGDDTFSPVSTEGYYHNDELMRQAAFALVQALHVQPGGKVLDVGYGSNFAVSEGMQAAGLKTFGLDFIMKQCSEHDSPRIPPHRVGFERGMAKYHGTIEELLHPESGLRRERFNLLVFWGSWDSGGYNFAVGGGETGEFRVRQEQPKLAKLLSQQQGWPWPEEVSERLYGAMQEHKRKVLETCAAASDQSGGVLIVSSRYAYHGAGFLIKQLPMEKRLMLRSAADLAELGASQLCIVGLSKKHVLEQLQAHSEERLTGVASALADDDVMFSMERGIYEARYPEQLVSEVKSWNVPLGRIDAVYGQFGLGHSESRRRGLLHGVKAFLNL